MTGSEFAFLAMGLVLGIAAGAALILTVRSRPSNAREVRVTMTADAVPRRRAATLASDAFAEARLLGEPARGGPADRRETDPVPAPGASDGRTGVHVPQPGTIVEPAFKLTGPSPDPWPILAGDRVASSGAPTPPAAATGLSIASGIDPMLSALRASAAAAAEAAMPSIANVLSGAGDRVAAAVASGPVAVGQATGDEGSKAGAPARAGGATAGATAATADGDGGRQRSTSTGSTGSARATRSAATSRDAGPSDGGRADPDDGGPCAEVRRIADERCELATRARAHASDAEGDFRTAQRAYDDHETAAAEAAAAADPRAIREAKDLAQATFRAGRLGAKTNEAVEAAARTWLLEINEINGRAREAANTLAKAHAAAPEFAVRLERAAVAADAARIAAEAAEQTCVAARQALAQCEEQAARGTLGIVPQVPPPGGDEEPISDSETLITAIRAGTPLRVIRLLRGDRSAMQELVAALAGDTMDERRRWQVAISDLVDAILADTIEASALDFPTEHSFWGPFSISQSRDITAALSSLGYRFDGIGGWVDERVPSQRDLSLALGYAGFDPMRMRHWPNEAEMSSLFSEVEVAAAEHLAGNAGDLTLGELVAMLGRRADGLTDVWNAWGRIRPLLLEEG